MKNHKYFFLITSDDPSHITFCVNRDHCQHLLFKVFSKKTKLPPETYLDKTRMWK